MTLGIWICFWMLEHFKGRPERYRWASSNIGHNKIDVLGIISLGRICLGIMNASSLQLGGNYNHWASLNYIGEKAHISTWVFSHMNIQCVTPLCKKKLCKNIKNICKNNIPFKKNYISYLYLMISYHHVVVQRPKDWENTN